MEGNGQISVSLAKLLRGIFEKLPYNCDIEQVKKIDELINLICLFKLVSFMKNTELTYSDLEEEVGEYENILFLSKHNLQFKNKIIIIFEIQVSLCMQKFMLTGDYEFKYIGNCYKRLINDMKKEHVRPITYVKIEHKFKKSKNMLPGPKLYI
jgi:hypothetical protein